MNNIWLTVTKLVAVILVVFGLLFLISLFDLYSQLGRYGHYWKEKNKIPQQDNEILYVALGDSTAQGIGASSPKRGYVSLVANHIENSQSKSVRTINLSKSGAKVKDVIEKQIPELNGISSAKNSVITIEIGANDMIDYDEAKFSSQMDELMGKLPKQTLISDIPYFGDTRFKSRQPNVERANAIMGSLAAKHGFDLVPLHDRVKQNGGLKTLAVDFFHPSNKSYKENWAYVFIKRLDEISI